MTSHLEPSPPATCTATTKLGRRCRKPVVERGLCLFHCGKLGDPAERGRRGGQARARRSAPQDRVERIRELMWMRLEQTLADPNTRDTAAVRAVTEAFNRFEPMFNNEAARLARQALAGELAGVLAGARHAAEQGDCERVLAELDRARLNDAEPVVFEYETDPARMLDLLVELGLSTRCGRSSSWQGDRRLGPTVSRGGRWGTQRRCPCEARRHSLRAGRVLDSPGSTAGASPNAARLPIRMEILEQPSRAGLSATSADEAPFSS
jgi:hypothetical protein